jgi:hypothetical protein
MSEIDKAPVEVVLQGLAFMRWDLNLLTFSFVMEKRVVMNGDQTCWKEEADLLRLQ